MPTPSTAWLYGCTSLNGTLLGIGERSGNPPVEGLVIEYISASRATRTGFDTDGHHRDRRLLRARDRRTALPSNYPFVGRDFNVTRAGIHADGLLKDEEIYNIFDTTKLPRAPAARR